MELFRGINQIKVPLPKSSLNSINVYIIEGNNGNLMIDTGWNIPESFNALVQEMKNSGFAMKDITQVVVTHLHPDHYGLAGKIAELSGATVAMSEIESKFLDSRYLHPDSLLARMRKFLADNGVPDYELKMLAEASMNIRSYITTIAPSSILNHGDRLSIGPFEFEVILTPGHSPGHICLYEPDKKYLFSGDQLLPEIAPNISYHQESGENPLGDYINSLNQLSEREIHFVFPGHGPVFSGLGPEIDNIFRHHRDKMMKIEKIMGINTKNAFDIAKELPWIINGEDVPYNKLEPIDRRLAILETLAYLQFMVAENKGKKIYEGDKVVYWAGVNR